MYSRKVGEDDPTSLRVLGCAFEVGKVLGPGSLESVYEKALCIGLAKRGPQPSIFRIFRLIYVHSRSLAENTVHGINLLLKSYA